MGFFGHFYKKNKVFIKKVMCVALLAYLVTGILSFSVLESHASSYGSWLTSDPLGTTTSTSGVDDSGISEVTVNQEISTIELFVGYLFSGPAYAIDMMVRSIGVDCSISGVIMGRSVNNGRNYFQFDLMDNNIYGTIAATIFWALRAIAMTILIFIVAVNVINTLLAPDVKAWQGLKEAIIGGVGAMIIMLIMPQIVDWVCKARDVLSIWLYNLELSFIPAYQGKDSATFIASTINLADIYREYYEGNKSLVNALIFLAVTCLPVFFITNYVKIALTELMLFGLFPVFCALSQKDKKLLGQWMTVFFTNLLIPSIDLALVLLPQAIIVGMEKQYTEKFGVATAEQLASTPHGLGWMVLKAVVTIVALMSIIPIRNQILNMMGNMFTVKAGNLFQGAAAAAGFAAGIAGGIKDALGGKEKERGNAEKEAEESAQEVKDQTDRMNSGAAMADDMPELKEVPGSDEGAEDSAGAGVPAEEGASQDSEGLDDIPGSDDEESDGEESDDELASPEEDGELPPEEVTEESAEDFTEYDNDNIEEDVSTDEDTTGGLNPAEELSSPTDAESEDVPKDAVDSEEGPNDIDEAEGAPEGEGPGAAGDVPGDEDASDGKQADELAEGPENVTDSVTPEEQGEGGQPEAVVEVTEDEAAKTPGDGGSQSAPGGAGAGDEKPSEGDNKAGEPSEKGSGAGDKGGEKASKDGGKSGDDNFKAPEGGYDHEVEEHVKEDIASAVSSSTVSAGDLDPEEGSAGYKDLGSAIKESSPEGKNGDTTDVDFNMARAANLATMENLQEKSDKLEDENAALNKEADTAKSQMLANNARIHELKDESDALKSGGGNMSDEDRARVESNNKEIANLQRENKALYSKGKNAESKMAYNRAVKAGIDREVAKRAGVERQNAKVAERRTGNSTVFRSSSEMAKSLKHDSNVRKMANYSNYQSAQFKGTMTTQQRAEFAREQRRAEAAGKVASGAAKAARAYVTAVATVASVGGGEGAVAWNSHLVSEKTEGWSDAARHGAEYVASGEAARDIKHAAGQVKQAAEKAAPIINDIVYNGKAGTVAVEAGANVIRGGADLAKRAAQGAVNVYKNRDEIAEKAATAAITPVVMPVVAAATNIYAAKEQVKKELGKNKDQGRATKIPEKKPVADKTDGANKSGGKNGGRKRSGKNGGNMPGQIPIEQVLMNQALSPDDPGVKKATAEVDRKAAEMVERHKREKEEKGGGDKKP